MDQQTLLTIGKRLKELEKLFNNLSIADINNQSKLRGKNKILLDHFENSKSKIINKDEIAEIIWDNPDVTDWAINQVISRFRKKLKKLGINPKRLETINNRGYMWN